MCNSVHETGSRPIRKTGQGWKWFSVEDGKVLTLISKRQYDGNVKKGWIKWHEGFFGDGFCFFMSKKEAINAMKDPWWQKKIAENRISLLKVRYKRGIVRQQEDNFADYVIELAICKEFQIVEEA